MTCLAIVLTARNVSYLGQVKLRNSVYVTPVPPVAVPFDRWGLDFVGRLSETRNGNKFIITAIDYASRWLVARAVKTMEENVVVDFLYREIFSNYGVPSEIINDRGMSFLGAGVQEFIRKYQIHHLKTSPYHPQTNGMVERVHSILNHSI